MVKCELCGGDLVIKSDECVECASCGMKYSLDYIKQKMNSPTSANNRSNSVNTASKNDDSSQFNKYIDLANNAFAANNRVDAENYARKALELNPSSSKANLIKGKSICLQYEAKFIPINNKTSDLRLSEILCDFTNAIKNAADNVAYCLS